MPETKTEIAERAFTCRVFFRRGGRSMVESYTDAKTQGVAADWFSDPACECVWTAAERLFASGDFDETNFFKLTHGAAKVASERKDEKYRGVKTDFDFFDRYTRTVDGSDDLGGYVKMLREMGVARKTMEACKAARAAFACGEDSVSTASRLVSEIQGVIGKESGKGRASVASLVDEVVAQYENAYHHVQELGERNYTPGLSLPWRKLAFAMNGFTAVMTVVAARPGVGKTSFAVEMMRYWMDTGVKVVFDSLDMAGVEFMKRQLSEISQVSSRKLQFGKSTKEQWEKYDLPAVKEAGERMKRWEREGIFTLFTEPDADVLKANARILRDQGRIDVLVVDYIQLMTYRGAEKVSKQQCVTRVSNILHSITTELGIPVLALSQINRDSSKEGIAPQLHDIKDSGAIEQDATNVIILHPDRKLKQEWAVNPPAGYMRNRTEDTDSVRSLMPMWVILAKARDGDAGTEIPFVVMQNKYSWYQADYRSGDRNAKFLRVWENWKHDPIEKVWAQNGVLIAEEDENAIADRNAALIAAARRREEESGRETDPLDAYA